MVRSVSMISWIGRGSKPSVRSINGIARSIMAAKLTDPETLLAYYIKHGGSQRHFRQETASNLSRERCPI